MADHKKAFICGWPVAHSRSPVIHRYWLRQLGIKGDYLKQPVQAENLPDFLKNIANKGFVGGNVTLPHKEQAFALADVVDQHARALGAVNTLWLEDEKLHGSNTDGYGFLANLDQHAKGWDERNDMAAIVLGAGGAARAIVHAIQSRGFSEIHLINRTRSRAVAIAGHFSRGITPHIWEELPALMPNCALLVNTTSLGMDGKAELEIDLAPLPKKCLVSDIVYMPLETALLKQARALGLKNVDGLGMLLHQAVPGFEKWFGARPVVDDALRRLVIEDMGAGQ